MQAGDVVTDSPADALAQVGRALYGEDAWVKPFADRFGVSRDTIRRWLTGRSDLRVDHGIFNDSLDVLAARIAELETARVKLALWMSENGWNDRPRPRG
jgi:hypothetical protein